VTVEFKKYLRIIFLQLALLVAVGQSIHILHHLTEDTIEKSDIKAHDIHGCELCIVHFNQLADFDSEELVQIPTLISSLYESVIPYHFHEATINIQYKNLRAPPFVI